MKDFDADPKRDLPKERPLGLATGGKENDFVVKKRDDDPYGFWWITRERGQVPDALKGAYTTPDRAERAVKEYLDIK